MNLKQLLYFCEVVSAGNANAAAARLCVAPTAISMQIAQLEADLGGKLFDRSSRPMSLTALGQFFHPKARVLLSDANRLREETRGMAAGKLGWLSVGFTRSAIFSILPNAVRTMKSMAPQLQIDLIETLTEHQVDSLRSGLIHVGVARVIGAYAEETDIRYTPLFPDPLVAALPHHHALAQRHSVRARELDTLPFITYPKDPSSHFAQQFLGLLEAAGASPRVGYEAKEIHTALSLVAAGLGATLVGQSVAENNRTDVRFLPLSDLQADAQVFVMSRKHETNPLAATFIQVLREQAPQARP